MAYMPTEIAILDSKAVMKELADIKADLKAVLLSMQQRPEEISPGIKWQNATVFMRDNGIGRRRFARLVDSGMVAAKDIGGRGKVYRWAD